MNIALSNDKLNKLRKIFHKYPEIEKVLVYGSRVLGTSKVGSDIDLSLVGDISLNLYSTLKIDLDDLYFSEIIDISIYNEIKNENLLEHINHFGILIYP